MNNYVVKVGIRKHCAANQPIETSTIVIMDADDLAIFKARNEDWRVILNVWELGKEIDQKAPIGWREVEAGKE